MSVETRRRAWVVSGAVAACAAAALVGLLAPGCVTHQCDTSSYDYYGGKMIDANTYETSDWDLPWLAYNGNVTVRIHFPPEVHRVPNSIIAYVGTSPTPGGGPDFMGGENFTVASGQLSEMFFVDSTGFSALNASCASYFARFVANFPPVAATTFTLFGGLNGGGSAGIGRLADTWTWNGSQWSAVPPTDASTGPTARSGITMASAGGSQFLYGGDLGNHAYDNGLWRWDGTSWSPQYWPCTAPDAGPNCFPPIPTGRAYETFVSLPARARADGGPVDEIVMFGGITAPPLPPDVDGGADSGRVPPLDVPNAETWIWDGTSLNALSPAHSPSARWGAAAAALNGAVVLFGGTADGVTPLGDMWLWDDDAHDWQSIPMPAAGPSPRFLASAATLGDKIVVFGGTDGLHDLGDTWLWDGTAWTQVQGSGPSPRSNASMGVFGSPPAPLLFGGLSQAASKVGFADAALGDLWEFTGTAWQQIAQIGLSPSPRGGAGAAGL